MGRKKEEGRPKVEQGHCSMMAEEEEEEEGEEGETAEGGANNGREDGQVVHVIE